MLQLSHTSTNGMKFLIWQTSQETAWNLPDVVRQIKIHGLSFAVSVLWGRVSKWSHLKNAYWCPRSPVVLWHGWSMEVILMIVWTIWWSAVSPKKISFLLPISTLMQQLNQKSERWAAWSAPAPMLSRLSKRGWRVVKKFSLFLTVAWGRILQYRWDSNHVWSGRESVTLKRRMWSVSMDFVQCTSFLPWMISNFIATNIQASRSRFIRNVIQRSFSQLILPALLPNWSSTSVTLTRMRR